MNSNKATLETHSQRDKRLFKNNYVTQHERRFYSDLAARIERGQPLTDSQRDFVANIGGILKKRGEP